MLTSSDVSPTRDRILAASASLFLQRGGDTLSMRRVADRIGVTATAIYRHFPGRAQLVEAVIEHAFGVFEHFLLAALPPRGSGRAQLGRFARQYLEFVIRKPRLFEVLFLRRRPGLRRFPDDFVQRPSRAFDLLHAAVRSGMASGALRSDIDSRELALAVWNFAHGFAAQYWVGRFGDDVMQVRRLYHRQFDLLLEGLAP